MTDSRITFTLNEVVSNLNSHGDAILRARFDITFSQFLFLLSLSGGKTSLAESAKYQGVSVAAISKRIDWFEERGLVKAQFDVNRNRKVSLQLTAKGRNLVEKSSAVLESMFRDIFHEFKSMNLDQLNKNLRIINDYLITLPKEQK